MREVTARRGRLGAVGHGAVRPGAAGQFTAGKATHGAVWQAWKYAGKIVPGVTVRTAQS